MIEKKAGEMFKKQQVINNKGQIVNQEKFNQALEKIMIEKFAGGMEKQATTVKGLWSTVTGVTKSALANIMGISNAGDIVKNSPMAILKDQIQQFADKLVELQQSGAFQQISNVVSEFLVKSMENATKTIAYLKDNINWILPIAKGLLVAFVGFNTLNPIFKGISSTFMGFKAVILGVKAAYQLLASEKVKDIAATLYLKGLYAKDMIMALLKSTGAILANSAAWVANKLQILAQNAALLALKGVQLISQGVTMGLTAAQWALNAAMSANTIGLVIIAISALVAVGVALWKNWDTLKEKAVKLVEPLKDVIGWVKEFFRLPGKKEISLTAARYEDGPDNRKPKPNPSPSSPSQQRPPRHALGTSYFAGGATRINEGGRDEMAVLPSGTGIMSSDKTDRLIENKGNGAAPIIVHIHGNIYGEEDLVNKIGSVFLKRVQLAYKNSY